MEILMKALQYLGDRAREPSTYAGLAAAVAGLGVAFDVREAPVVAEGVAQVGQAVATHGWVGGAVAALGILSVFLRERGK